jgi:hypothetical protein
MRPALLVVVALLTAGCARPAAVARPAPGGAPVIAVLPFRTGGTLDAQGAFRPGPQPGVDATAGDVVADAIRSAFAARGVRTVGGDATAGALALADAGTYDPALAARVGRRLGAEVVVLGAVARFRERVGSAWAAATPASVAYEAAAVRVADAALLRRDAFDWTQQALSENLLQLPRFLEGGGHWLTREEMIEGAARHTAERLARAAAPGG